MNQALALDRIRVTQPPFPFFAARHRSAPAGLRTSLPKPLQLNESAEIPPCVRLVTASRRAPPIGGAPGGPTASPQVVRSDRALSSQSVISLGLFQWLRGWQPLSA